MNTFMILVLLGKVLTSQAVNSAHPENPVNDRATHETITAQQLLNKIDNGEQFQLIDCRPREEFLYGHIPGAVNISIDTYTFDRETVLKRSIERIQDEVGKKIDFILIDGATGVPYMSISKLRELSSYLPEDRDVLSIFYCRRPNCTRSPMAMRWAAALGYERLYRYAGGWQEWEKKDHPFEQNHMNQ